MDMLDEGLQQSLRRLMDHAQLTQASVARAVGLSSTVVSQILGSKPDVVLYKGSLEKTQRKLRAFVERETVRQASPAPPAFVETAAASAILDVLRHAHIHRTIGVIVGPPGIGKSFTIEHYGRNVGDAIYVQANSSWRTKGALVNVCEALGLQTGGESWRLVERAVEALTDTGKLIVVDEAQFLPYDTLETLRCIHDRARMGLVYAGMQRLYDNMLGRRRGLYAHLFSRVGKCVVLGGDSGRKDVARLVIEMFPDADEKSLARFERIANDPVGGRLRSLVQMLCHLRRHCNITHEKLSVPLIETAGGLLMTVDPHAN